jgi:hypothetical protein
MFSKKAVGTDKTECYVYFAIMINFIKYYATVLDFVCSVQWWQHKP